MGENQSSRSGASGPVVLSSKSFGAGKVSPACLKSATSEERAKAMPSMICSAVFRESFHGENDVLCSSKDLFRSTCTEYLGPAPEASLRG